MFTNNLKNMDCTQENQKKLNSSYINKTFCLHKEILQLTVKERQVSSFLQNTPLQL